MSAWPSLAQFLAANRHAPTLSVYLEAAPADPAEGRAVALRLREAIERLREPSTERPVAEREALEGCLAELIEAMPSAEHRSRRQGWAFFRTAAGAQLVIETPPRVETSAAWDIGPRVVPFLRAAEPESALLVQIDRARARLGLYHDGVVDAIVELEADRVSDVGPHMSAGPAPGFHRGTHGRAGADEAERQRRDASERLLVTTVRRVTALAEDALPVVVGGAVETVKRFVAALPRALADRTAVVATLRMGPADAAIPEIGEALRAMRQREQAAHLADLRDAAAARGRAALGFERAQRAAEVGAIAELIFSDTAWRAHPAEIEALVHRALTSGASVEWTPLDDGDAPQADGVVAGLRFSL
ncbi:hypothetical protein Strain138_000902 [Pseudogemmatithrix spongiicola]|uniref:eRF1 domain-containing protein n=1 Tax=Pseudogemmatithrix spongiicola TaxID=3062599 RepID=A0AA49JZ64_9BACT|nr:hypothetical protein Strain138_000902 [Gemmatimonadaceae bacterium 'strain 138']WKW14555.1 hypothetical protein Strain318_000902 [Gemmatimonadaceae bacterium 'strain 318']